ncbi:MAG: hypothetical protein Fur0037_04440 [Planctomycetota bacterium]
MRNALREELLGCLRAYAQILFQRSALLGGILLASTMLSPAAGALGLLAVASAHATSAVLGYRADLRRSGVFGYNAALLGLYLGAGHGLTPDLAAFAILAGAASLLVYVVASEWLLRTGSLPVLVLPFVLVAILLQPALPDPGGQVLSFWPVLGDEASSTSDALLGFASIFCLHGVVAGLAVFAAALLTSRIGALALVTGAAAALWTGRLAGVPEGSDLSISLAYNGALTGLTLGAVLFAPSRASFLLASLGSLLTALACIGFTSVLQRLQLPVLSGPFVVVTLVMTRALQLRVPGRRPFPSPLPGSSPEANAEFVANMSRRFGAFGVPSFALPFQKPERGQWVVSQGFGGSVTHRGPWHHAIDFEIADENGFPFAGEGRDASDYFAFGAEVLAPAAGTVVSISDGAPDGEPGSIDATKPWGNAIVLQHGIYCYSLMAHLRRGSIRVRPGQFVSLGERLAECGASGRSPRPHLHFQVQRHPELGAPAIASRFVNYCASDGMGAEICRSHGVPREGERVRPLPTARNEGIFRFVLPGAEHAFDVTPAGAALHVRSEISPLGERWLLDIESGDRLWFLVNEHEVVFTTYAGRAGSPLEALFLALPRMPFHDGSEWTWTDRPPITVGLSPAERLLRRLVRVLLDPFDASAELTAQRFLDRILVESEFSIGRKGRVRPRWRARVDIDSLGPVSVSVCDATGRSILGLERREESPPPLRLQRKERA